jgi:hypothetical protein
MGSPIFLSIAEKFGADRVLSKPFEMEALLETVRDLLVRA